MKQLNFADIELWLEHAASGRLATAAILSHLAEQRGLCGADALVVEHDHFAGRAQDKLSIAHTGGLGAVAVSASAELLGLGCDLECAGRAMRPGVGRHLLHPADGPAWRENLLHAWVAKEAAFKALDPHRARWTETTLVLSRIWLSGQGFGLDQQTQALGVVSVEEIDWQGTALLLALARLPQPGRAA